MAETKLNLNYQVDATQFENKVGTAIDTGEASDEVQDKIDAILNENSIGGGLYDGGHNHSGTLKAGEKIDYPNLTNIPSSFNPSTHSHPFTEITGDIGWAQIDALISTGSESNKIIAANDARLSDNRDPNAHEHVFSDLTDDIIFTQLDSLISASSQANKLIEANDARLSDDRTPLSHDNTKHSATYITSAGVTFENLNANGDVGTASTQVSQGDHNHNTVYYTQTILDSALAGKSDTGHLHGSGSIREGALDDDVSYQNLQSRYFSFSPFGFGGWTINTAGAAEVTADGTGDKTYAIAIQMLPDEAEIDQFIMYVHATDVHNLTMKLFRTAFGDGVAEEVASLTHTTDSGTGFNPEEVSTSDIATGGALVDKTSFHYWVECEETGTSDAVVTIIGGIIRCDVDKPIP